MHFRITAALFSAVAALAFAGTSFAHEPAAAESKAKAVQSATKDTTRFCYLADQAYSEGAEVNGAVCQRQDTTTVFERGTLPLSWVRPPQIRSIQPRLSDGN